MGSESSHHSSTAIRSHLSSPPSTMVSVEAMERTLAEEVPGRHRWKPSGESELPLMLSSNEKPCFLGVTRG